jgi:outer membrane protein
MRNFSRVIFFSLLLFAGSLSAQTIKVGHINFQQLLQFMPERDAAQKAMTKIQTEYENQNTTLQKDYAEKLKEYQTQDQQKTLSDAARIAKEGELQSLASRIQTFQQTASENLQKEQDKQFQPIIDKARKAISDVAKEQGLLYVFDVNVPLYYSDQSIDILALVKTKLGIK